MPGKDKREIWSHPKVDEPTQLKMAGGACKATCATRHVGGLVVVVHSRRIAWARLALESAVDFVAIGRKPIKGACVGNTACRWIWRAWIEFRAPGEGT